MLDTLAVAGIAHSLVKNDIPSLDYMSHREIERLRTIDGLGGVVEAHTEGSTSYEPAVASDKTVELGLGASGVFTRRLILFRVKRSSARMVGDVDMDCMCEGCRRRRRDVDETSVACATY